MHLLPRKHTTLWFNMVPNCPPQNRFYINSVDAQSALLNGTCGRGDGEIRISWCVLLKYSIVVKCLQSFCMKQK